MPVHAIVRSDPTAMRGKHKAGRVATDRLRPCRWTGTYASAKDRLALVDKPSAALRIVVVTSATGASISFALAEEVVADLFD